MQTVEAIHHRRFFDLIRDGVEVAFQHKHGGGQGLRYHGDDQRHLGVVYAKRGDDFEQRHHQQNAGEHIHRVKAGVDGHPPFKAQAGKRVSPENAEKYRHHG